MGSDAEVDYVIMLGFKMIPIEVKAGTSGRLRSIQLFLKEKEAPYGIRICGAHPQLSDLIYTLPFYLISQIQRLFRDIKV